MQRAGTIICWLSVVLIAILLCKPLLLELRHLQFYSPWIRSADDMKRYLQISFLIPFSLFGTLQRRGIATRFLIVLITLGATGAIAYYATRNIDRDPIYPSRTVRELYQNMADSSEKIILQTESDLSERPVTNTAILQVKPYSRELQIVHAADTNHLEAGKWRRLY